MSIGPGQFKSLPHDETTKEFVEDVPVLWLTQHHVLKLGVLHPHGVRRFHTDLETERSTFVSIRMDDF